MSVELWWKRSEDKRHVWLYAGCNENALAWIFKGSKGTWEAAIWLPEISPTRKHGPLEQQMADVHEKVLGWFAMATMNRPAMDPEANEEWVP